MAMGCYYNYSTTPLPKPKPLQISALKSTNPNPRIQLNRRSLLFLSTSLSLPPLLTLAATEENAPIPAALPDTTITDRVFMDFSICPNYFGSDRTLGDDLTACQDAEPIGRVVFGLYGKLVPITVSHFKTMCKGSNGSSYKGTLVQRILPGQYFAAGKQGRRNKGEVRPPIDLAKNTESVESKAFVLGHSRPGVLSLCLAENDDEDEIKLDPNYRNVEFLITTGPGPAPQLDYGNIVFGTVLQGLDVVTTIASIPTYKPSERIRQLNDLAEYFGDDRAQNARTIWNRPLKTVYISDCGELKVAKPSLSPSLP
ncbi:hypothetical protein GIB67_016778 [Kingdonia uniflora]|uniref:PPIase cyclophilin-type domain-containing protein n=1 Tax=Kingdonia uniflora TaxID=39325 RepID=A0A7J7LXP0_9MAGN|nr:hypothetical protein GIB67_016778 [Kingdonia uniflora]